MIFPCRLLILPLLAGTLLLGLHANSLQAADSDVIRILAISPGDRRVVLDLPGEGMRTAGVGDALPGGLIVREVAPNRVHLEAVLEGRIETIIIRKQGGAQQIQRLSGRLPGGPARSPEIAPVSLPIN